MDSPCTNHAYPIKHLYKDRELLKRFLRQAGGPKESDGKEVAAKKGGAADKDRDSFPDPKECIMIFGGIQRHLLQVPAQGTLQRGMRRQNGRPLLP